jgi:hypothetical protein
MRKGKWQTKHVCSSCNCITREFDLCSECGTLFGPSKVISGEYITEGVKKKAVRFIYTATWIKKVIDFFTINSKPRGYWEIKDEK